MRINNFSRVREVRGPKLFEQNCPGKQKEAACVGIYCTDGKSLNACGGNGRSVESIIKRWKDMKSKVKNKPGLGRLTGGGPPEPPVPFEEAILAIVQGSSTLNGVGK